MENNNNNTVNILSFDVKTGSIGMDQQLFTLLSQLIVAERQNQAERRKEYESRETARHNVELELQKLRIKREELELEKVQFQLDKEKFKWDLEKAQLLKK